MNLKSFLGKKDADGGSKAFDFNEFMQSFNQLDPQNMGGWPKGVKIVLCALLFAAIVLLAYLFLMRGQMDDLDAVTRKQDDLLKTFAEKSEKLKNLQAYEIQLEKMKSEFSELLHHLPNQKEIPGLIEDISFTGAGSGVRLNDIKVETEIPKSSFIELPLVIQAQGDYHAFGTFVSGLSSLPRIVTANDFEVTPLEGKKKNEVPVLKLVLHSQTYHTPEVTAAVPQPVGVAASAGKGPLPQAKDVKNASH